MAIWLYDSGAEYILNEAFSANTSNDTQAMFYKSPQNQFVDDAELVELTDHVDRSISYHGFWATIGMSDVPFPEGIAQTNYMGGWVNCPESGSEKAYGIAVLKGDAAFPLQQSDIIFTSHLDNPLSISANTSWRFDTKFRMSNGATA